jgi:hypothetical protein
MTGIERRRPAIFIGSSAEQYSVANAIQVLLDFEYEPAVWSQDIFRPSSYAVIDLIRATRLYDFAVFVFAPDDIVVKRGDEAFAVRDNVIFELGVFMGALFPERCFIVVPRGNEKLRLPTDLLGFTPLTYRHDRHDANILAAVGPACFQIKREVDRLFPRPTAMVEPLSAEAFISEWNGSELSAAREALRELPLDHYGEEAQAIRPSLKRVFRFLEDMATAVMAGQADEGKLRQTFERPVASLWPHFFTLLAPPNQADEWWEKRPAKLAEIYTRWT